MNILFCFSWLWEIEYSHLPDSGKHMTKKHFSFLASDKHQEFVAIFNDDERKTKHKIVELSFEQDYSVHGVKKRKV